ncbi:MAG: hypothetical protein UU43_C0004G0032 [Candidatus Falkowbacteria bacterium GW2011_GWA2_41_14]|uniref:Uncharacterized protein n=1 Tax=Candidatus Falkowbacteria bacterium GW2011_GWA2_41_14 TaxID=1618635 RepID=A0A0G0US62_9BACT|nr:MAG: hypothetical protein UU43_C0004G0032 [Candidatus Falkowbacteria bacterium GW2011_GWA2_41_14]
MELIKHITQHPITTSAQPIIMTDTSDTNSSCQPQTPPIHPMFQTYHLPLPPNVCHQAKFFLADSQKTNTHSQQAKQGITNKLQQQKRPFHTMNTPYG